jgi:transposase
MSYSLDFRRQVLKIKHQEKLTDSEFCVRFGISTRTLYRWKKNIAPTRKRNRSATKIDMEALKKHVDEYPDAYQYERAAVFGVSPNCILYALRRLKISHKKNAVPSQIRPSKKS